MNKQEAIKRVEELYGHGSIAKTVIDIISQIHEPQKVVVPKFVAEWIEECKGRGCSLRGAMRNINLSGKANAWFIETGQDGATYPNQETFARAWLFGYEVEQEQLYTVEIPDPNGWYKVRCLTRRSNGKLCIDGYDYKDILLETRARFTESEIKQDFEWAWDAGFAKEVEL